MQINLIIVNFSGSTVFKSDIKFEKWFEDQSLHFGLCDALKSIHKSIDGTGIRIAIIDGIDKYHPKDSNIVFKHKALQETDIAIINMAICDDDNHIMVVDDNDDAMDVDTTEGEDDDVITNYDDYNNHALVCTSIAVGKAFDDGLRVNSSKGVTTTTPYPGGVAPGATATVFLVDFENFDTVLKALHEVIAGNYHVLSLSWGDHDSNDVFTEHLNKLKDKTIIVAAAGNSGNNYSVEYPARLPNVISVGSLDKNFKVSNFSADNEDVNTYYCGEVFAPCMDPTGLMLKNSTGTSMATPGIAGLVCLLMQCAIKHGYEVQMRKTENMRRLLERVIQNNSGRPTHNLEFLKKAHKKKEIFDEILGRRQRD